MIVLVWTSLCYISYHLIVPTIHFEHSIVLRININRWLGEFQWVEPTLQLPGAGGGNTKLKQGTNNTNLNPTGEVAADFSGVSSSSGANSGNIVADSGGIVGGSSMQQHHQQEQQQQPDLGDWRPYKDPETGNIFWFNQVRCIIVLHGTLSGMIWYDMIYDVALCYIIVNGHRNSS